jgi:hypothetical protein
MSISPPVLFFVLGMVAALVRSGLRIPKAVTKLMSLYLLWAIGFTGGVKIAQSGLDQQAMFAIVIGVAMAAIVPLIVFAVLRKRLGIDDAVAGVILLRRAEQAAAPSESRGSVGWGKLLHEAFLNGPVLLLLGSLVIGLVTRERGFEAFKPLCKDLFNGVLVFFLLDLGLLAARRLRGFLSRGWFLVAFGVIFPPVSAAAALLLARLAGLSLGDATLLATLAASASYIAVPAAARIAIPKADPSIYIGLSLAVTFPFNVVVGIPLYLGAARAIWGS